MLVKKRNRYYCEFCKKANCSGASISKHEKRCTKNPNRICGMCKLFDNKQQPIEILLAILPDPKKLVGNANEIIGHDILIIDENWSKAEIELKNALLILRDVSGNCPACIMAAMRQKGIPIPLINTLGFDFSKESKEVWTKFNDSQLEDERYYL